MAEKKPNKTSINRDGVNKHLPLSEGRSKNSQEKPASTTPRNFVSPPPSAKPGRKE